MSCIRHLLNIGGNNTVSKGLFLSGPLLAPVQDNKADVILKYNADEARSLKAYGELPEHGELHDTYWHRCNTHTAKCYTAAFGSEMEQ